MRGGERLSLHCLHKLTVRWWCENHLRGVPLRVDGGAIGVVEEQRERLGEFLRLAVVQDLDVELLLEVLAILPHETAVVHGLEVAAHRGIPPTEECRHVHCCTSIHAETTLDCSRGRDNAKTRNEQLVTTANMDQLVHERKKSKSASVPVTYATPKSSVVVYTGWPNWKRPEASASAYWENQVWSKTVKATRKYEQQPPPFTLGGIRISRCREDRVAVSPVRAVSKWDAQVVRKLSVRELATLDSIFMSVRSSWAVSKWFRPHSCMLPRWGSRPWSIRSRWLLL